MVFGNGVKNIQAVAYNGARTVYYFYKPHYEIGGAHTVGQGLYLLAPFEA